MLRYLAAGLSLAGLILTLWLLKKQSEKSGVSWKDYPGFAFFPKEETVNTFLTEVARPLLPLLCSAAVFTAAILEVAAWSITGIAPLRIAMFILPAPMLLLQAVQLVIGLRISSSRKASAAFSVISGIKMVLAALWVVCMFAILLYRGAQL